MRVAIWDDLSDVLPSGPVGVITAVADLGGPCGVDVTVQLDGFGMAFTFGLDEVEFVGEDEALRLWSVPPGRPCDGAGRTRPLHGGA